MILNLKKKNEKNVIKSKTMCSLLQFSENQKILNIFYYERHNHHFKYV